MQRRHYLKAMIAGGAALSARSAFSASAHPIVLEVDLSVDPAREKEMLDNFHNTFKPVAVKHPGYIDVKILKLRSALMGSAPDDGPDPMAPEHVAPLVTYLASPAADLVTGHTLLVDGGWTAV